MARKFKLVYPKEPHHREKYGGSWHCCNCGRLAAAKREKEECHRCRDWSSCGNDCRLSELSCLECGEVQTY
jgi:hypothetical protein